MIREIIVSTIAGGFVLGGIILLGVAALAVLSAIANMYVVVPLFLVLSFLTGVGLRRLDDLDDEDV